MDTATIIGLITTGLALLSTAIGLGFKVYTEGKQIVKDKNWSKIMQIALSAIQAAEKSGASGADKKAQAIAAVTAACAEINIDVAPFMGDLSVYIDEIVAVTKKVNVK